MRLIDADSLYMNLVKMKDFGELTAKKAIRAVETAPTIDAVPVIRCRYCEHYAGEGMYCAWNMIAEPNGFCHHANEEPEYSDD